MLKRSLALSITSIILATTVGCAASIDYDEKTYEIEENSEGSAPDYAENEIADPIFETKVASEELFAKLPEADWTFVEDGYGVYAHSDEILVDELLVWHETISLSDWIGEITGSDAESIVGFAFKENFIMSFLSQESYDDEIPNTTIFVYKNES